MRPFDIAAILLFVAAACGYINYRFLRLPATSGTLAVALVSSVVVMAADRVVPALNARAIVAVFIRDIDFNAVLMNGMLSFLLFAGALHVDVRALARNTGTITALSTVGVALSTALTGAFAWAIFRVFAFDVPWIHCFLFGALISPTDPIAVIGVLRELGAPSSLEAQIAGESLFNDGVGVVVFVALASIAGFRSAADAAAGTDAGALAMFVMREVGGGIVLGLGMGYVAYHALKRIDEYSLELLVTLALVMAVYSLSFRFAVSGPIAVVVSGLLIGNVGRQFAMSVRTREHVDAFWQMIDEVLNAILFLLIGLEVLALTPRAAGAAAALAIVPAVLLARLIAVAVPVTVLSLRRSFHRGVIPILTWSGLRGGLSVAMALSLPQFRARELLMECTYAIVVFTILVQGLTLRPLLRFYGINRTTAQ
jgi:CPA1 family monovalent cation:H+ antiporter